MSVLACCVIVSDDPEVDSLVFKDLVVELEVPVPEFEVPVLEFDAFAFDTLELAFEGPVSLFNDLVLALEAPVAEFDIPVPELEVLVLEFDALAYDILAALAFGGLLVLLLLDLV